MIIGVNWLKKFAKIGDIKIEDLCEKIGARLVEIESVENLAQKYKDVIVAKVVKCEKIPETHLSLCKIDDGQVRENVERDADGLVQVVCGAPNVRENLLVTWLPPETIVPETFATDDEFQLTSRKLRGEISHGMLASPRELGLWDEHEGILEIDENLAKPGDSFAKICELNDYLLEVENKSLTHRPDCFGIVGFAREVAAICDAEFTPPEYFANKIELENTEKKLTSPTVEIANAELCNRYECVVLANVDGARKSSLLRETYLSRSGMRPISASVDITNYMMLESGQPLHAFDYDKLCQVSPTKKPDILVRAAKSGEKLELLDGKIIELADQDIVVCAGNSRNSVPIALAGAMGGMSTEIDDSTKNILLESATFNLYNLRGTQFRHGIFSEAITRFTKGQPAELCDHVIREASKQFCKFANAKIASDIVDNFAKKVENPEIAVKIFDVNSLLGTKITVGEMEKVLKNLGYKIEFREEKTDAEMFATAPWWRTDVKIREDVIEDIGRVLGFDNIAPTLPARDFAAVEQNAELDLKANIRETLASFGANEVLTYSFISEDLLAKVGQDSRNSYKIVNSISPKLQFVRQQLTPSLLEKVYENWRAGNRDFALFELNQTFRKEKGLTEEKVPVFSDNLAFAIALEDQSAPFYVAKKYAENLAERLHIKFDFREVANNKMPMHENFFEPKRTAEIWLNDTQIGVIGELKNSVSRNLKLPENVAAFEIGLGALLENLPPNGASFYQPISRFAGTSRDLTLHVSMGKAYATVESVIREILTNLPENFAWNLTPVDIFAPNTETKNLTFHLEIADHDKTIDTRFVAEVIDKIAKAVSEKLDAKII